MTGSLTAQRADKQQAKAKKTQSTQRRKKHQAQRGPSSHIRQCETPSLPVVMEELQPTVRQSPSMSPVRSPQEENGEADQPSELQPVGVVTIEEHEVIIQMTQEEEEAWDSDAESMVSSTSTPDFKCGRHTEPDLQLVLAEIQQQCSKPLKQPSRPPSLPLVSRLQDG